MVFDFESFEAHARTLHVNSDTFCLGIHGALTLGLRMIAWSKSLVVDPRICAQKWNTFLHNLFITSFLGEDTQEAAVTEDSRRKWKLHLKGSECEREAKSENNVSKQHCKHTMIVSFPKVAMGTQVLWNHWRPQEVKQKYDFPAISKGFC